MHVEDPGELASLVRIFQTSRCFPRGGAKARRSTVEGREGSHEEKRSVGAGLDG